MAKENRSGFLTLDGSTQGKHRMLSHVKQPSGKPDQNLKGSSAKKRSAEKRALLR